MKIEEGKYYKSRAGVVYGPMRKCPPYVHTVLRPYTIEFEAVRPDGVHAGVLYHGFSECGFGAHSGPLVSQVARLAPGAPWVDVPASGNIQSMPKPTSAACTSHTWVETGGRRSWCSNPNCKAEAHWDMSKGWVGESRQATPLTLRKGGKYRSRDGRIFEIIVHDPHNPTYPFEGKSDFSSFPTHSWTVDGKFVNEIVESSGDLIEEVV